MGDRCARGRSTGLLILLFIQWDVFEVNELFEGVGMKTQENSCFDGNVEDCDNVTPVFQREYVAHRAYHSIIFLSLLSTFSLAFFC